MTESRETTSDRTSSGGTLRAPTMGFDEYVARDTAGLAQLVREREVAAEELARMAGAAVLFVVGWALARKRVCETESAPSPEPAVTGAGVTAG